MVNFLYIELCTAKLITFLILLSSLNSSSVFLGGLGVLGGVGVIGVITYSDIISTSIGIILIASSY